MRPFRVGDDEFEHLVAFDASTVGGTTVTVAVETQSRVTELEILDTIISAAEGTDFGPFRDKPDEIENDAAYREMARNVVESNQSYLTATTHLGWDGSDQESVETVQSAVLYDAHVSGDPLVLLDGGREKADKFHRAVANLDTDPEVVATSVRAEQYQVTALLADIVARHLAGRIDSVDDCRRCAVEAPRTKSHYGPRWSRAYSSMQSVDTDPLTPEVRKYQTRRVRERIHCWHHGYLGGGTGRPESSSTNPVANSAERHGYEGVAKWLRRL